LNCPTRRIIAWRSVCGNPDPEDSRVHTVQTWLSGLPAGYTYVLIAVVIAVESMGVPLPGEIVLVAGALLASSGYGDIVFVVIAGCAGAIIGDSIGYAIGRRGGRPFLERLGRRFPKHMGPPQLARAERTFQKYGAWAIFFGRFVALLRILAGPLSGALHVRYRVFLAANAAGGIVWASGTALAVYFVGKAAEKWLSQFSWIALAVAVVGGVVTTLIIRHRATRHAPDDTDAPTESHQPTN
jgi:membrane protein DedA with SNARE-associated domain